MLVWFIIHEKGVQVEMSELFQFVAMAFTIFCGIPSLSSQLLADIHLYYRHKLDNCIITKGKKVLFLSN